MAYIYLFIYFLHRISTLFKYKKRRAGTVAKYKAWLEDMA